MDCSVTYFGLRVPAIACISIVLIHDHCAPVIANLASRSHEVAQRLLHHHVDDHIESLCMHLPRHDDSIIVSHLHLGRRGGLDIG
jgi:hypothetical protein